MEYRTEYHKNGSIDPVIERDGSTTQITTTGGWFDDKSPNDPMVITFNHETQALNITKNGEPMPENHYGIVDGMIKVRRETDPSDPSFIAITEGGQMTVMNTKKNYITDFKPDGTYERTSRGNGDEIRHVIVGENGHYTETLTKDTIGRRMPDSPIQPGNILLQKQQGTNYLDRSDVILTTRTPSPSSDMAAGIQDGGLASKYDYHTDDDATERVMKTEGGTLTIHCDSDSSNPWTAIIAGTDQATLTDNDGQTTNIPMEEAIAKEAEILAGYSGKLEEAGHEGGIPTDGEKSSHCSLPNNTKEALNLRTK